MTTTQGHRWGLYMSGPHPFLLQCTSLPSEVALPRFANRFPFHYTSDWGLLLAAPFVDSIYYLKSQGRGAAAASIQVTPAQRSNVLRVTKLYPSSTR